MADLRRLAREVKLLKKLQGLNPRVLRAVVTEAVPLRVILLDGLSTEPLEGSPITGMSGLVVGDEVLCLKQGNKLAVVTRLNDTGTRIFPSLQALQQWAAPDGVRAVVDTREYVSKNGAWKRVNPFGKASGRVVLTTTGMANGSTASVTVTLPVDEFTEPPNITGGVTSARLGYQFDMRTKTSFRFLAANFSGGSAAQGAGDPTNTIYGFWNAIQMTEGDASG